MSPKRITVARVEQAASEIKSAARFARGIDPGTRGRISYPSMVGALQSVLKALVIEAAGPKAGEVIDAAFADAFDDNSESARAAISKAYGAAS